MHAGDHSRETALRQGDERAVADQLRHPACGGRRHHLGGRADLQDPPAVQDRHPVREGLGGLELVGHQHGRHLPDGDQVPHQLGQVTAQARVQPGVRLVEEQRVTAAGQQPPERDPVRLPAGQPGRVVVQHPGEPQPPGDPGDLLPAGPRRGSVGQVPPHGQVREQRRVLAQQADPALPRRHVTARRGGPGQHPAAQHHGAADRLQHPGDGLEDRGLAGARGAEQGEPLPRGHAEHRGQPELAPVNLDVGLEHARSRCRRPGAAAGRPPAGPGRREAR